MKTITAFLTLASSLHCFGATHWMTDWFQETDTNILAVSDWSEPIQENYMLVRARMLLFEEYPPVDPSLDPQSLIKVYVELQCMALTTYERVLLYFDIYQALHWEISDARGKAVPPNGGMGGASWTGHPSEPSWLTLPADSTLRLRANFNSSLRSKSGVYLAIGGLRGQMWFFPPGDTNTYSVNATLNIPPPTNAVANAYQTNGHIWSGTFTLPKMKLSFNKPGRRQFPR